MLGYWASFLWVVTPFASIPLFVDRYQERWTEHFLPQALGLTSLSDFPSMVAVLAAALFVVRSLDASRVAEAALAGVLLGAAGGMKPPNLLMGVGAALAYLVARRWRDGIVFGAALVPSLLVLVLWKERGLGELPAVLAGRGAGCGRRGACRARRRPLHRARPRPLAPADGPAARVLLERAARPVGAVRGPARRHSCPPRRHRRVARRLARGVPPREGLLDASGHPGEHVLAAADARVAGLPHPLRGDPAARARRLPGGSATGCGRSSSGRSPFRWVVVAAS